MKKTYKMRLEDYNSIKTDKSKLLVDFVSRYKMEDMVFKYVISDFKY